jgi:colanic acid biosynthesis glycosyl transferase WcaI
MKINLITNHYPPEIGGAQHLFYELIKAFSEKGHQVTVVTRFPRYLEKPMRPDPGNKWIIREQRPEAKMIRVKVPELGRRLPLLREIEHVLNFLLFIVAGCLAEKPDVTLAYSPPLVVGYAALMVQALKRDRLVLNVQDLFPQSLIDIGVLKNPVLIWTSRALEKFLYDHVDRLTVMSEGNREFVGHIAKDPKKVSVVQNWIDPNSVRPGDKENEIRKEYGLTGKFVLTFAGVMADSQDLDIIIRAAAKLQNNDRIRFLLAGNGPNYDRVCGKIQQMALRNILIIPIQPFDRYVRLIAASDVGLVTLNPLVATPTVPSKIKSIMSAARPILASFPPAGDARKLIQEAECGIVVKAGDTEAFCAAIEKLANDPGLCERYGKNGRRYIIDHLSVDVAVAEYEKIFRSLLRDKSGEL